MATILTKKSDTASAVPLAADLTNAAGGAELAVNATDKRLFSKTSGGTVVELGTNPSTLVLPSGSANGVAYLNGSKVVTTGSALTFDGTNLALTTTGAIYKVPTAGGSLFDAGGNNGIYILGSSNYVATYVAGSEQMRLTSTGLGIGTSSPSNPLHIVSNTVSQLNVAALSGNTNAQINFEPTGTGIALIGPANNVAFAFRTNATERLRISADGNLGLGVTPSAWSTGKAMQFNSVEASVWGAGTQIDVASNAYFNGGWKYAATRAGASIYEQSLGTHAWSVAGSGTAGNAITFTQAMTLDASGNLGVGTTSPTTRLSITDSTGPIVRLVRTSNRFELSADTDFMSLNARDASTYITFKTADTERARIDSSGNLLVGNTGPANGRIDVTSNSGGTAINVRARSGNDYGFIQFKSNDDATVWGEVYGTSSIRLYCDAGGTNGVYLTSGATSWTANSDERLKENLVPIENGLSKVCSLRSVIGNFISDETKTKKPFLIAQDVLAVLPEAVSSGAIPKSEDTTEYLGVAYTEVIPLLVAAIKEQQAIIESLKARLDAANL